MVLQPLVSVHFLVDLAAKLHIRDHARSHRREVVAQHTVKAQDIVPFPKQVDTVAPPALPNDQRNLLTDLPYPNRHVLMVGDNALETLNIIREPQCNPCLIIAFILCEDCYFA